MITREGHTITRTDAHRHKYACAMAEYLDTRHDAYDNASGDVECPTGWFTRFGKRLLRGDDRGFVWCETYPDADGAEQVYNALDDLFSWWSDEECSDEEREQMITAHTRRVSYVIDCAENLCEPLGWQLWSMHGSPTSLIPSVDEVLS